MANDRRSRIAGASLTPLNIFGLVAIVFMLLCYLLEARSPWWTLGFAGGCLLSSIYGFLQGAWPFGAVELLWAGIALRRWRVASARRGAIDGEGMEPVA